MLDFSQELVDWARQLKKRLTGHMPQLNKLIAYQGSDVDVSLFCCLFALEWTKNYLL